MVLVVVAVVVMLGVCVSECVGVESVSNVMERIRVKSNTHRRLTSDTTTTGMSSGVKDGVSGVSGVGSGGLSFDFSSLSNAHDTTGTATTGTTGPATTATTTTGTTGTGTATTGPATTGPATTGPATTGTGPGMHGTTTTGSGNGPATTGMGPTTTTGPATTGTEGYSSGNTDKRYIVLHLNSLGFANRIRTVADFYTIAVYSGRTLLLSWQPSIDCNTSFTDLFIAGPEYLKVLPTHLPHDDVAARKHVQDKATLNGLTFADFDAHSKASSGSGDDSRYFASPSLFDTNINVIFTNYWGSTALRHLPCQHFIISKSKFYKSLVPVPEVASVVASVKQKFEGKIMIGVHIRGFDQKFDWAVGKCSY